MLQKESINRERRVFLLVPGILAVVLYCIYVLSTNFSEPENFSVPFLLQSVFFFYIYLLVIQQIDRLWQNRLEESYSGWSRVTGFLTALGISLMITLVFYVLLKQFYISFLGQNDTITFYHLVTRSLGTIVGFVLVFSVYISVQVYNESLEKELSLEQARHRQAALRYEQLSKKLDPHFLFNNLNTLHTLLPVGAEKAERFIVSLSRILRYSLHSGKDNLVPLREELEILSEYVSVMKSRFGDSLIYTCDVVIEGERFLYPMTLLHLMENAVKNNEVSEAHPLKVSLTQNGAGIRFRNNRNPKMQESSHGGSLQTLRELYLLKEGSNITVNETEEEFAVTIPLLNRSAS